jgi:hypothetical protein
VFYHFVCLRPVSCAPNVARVSGMFILDWPFIRSIYLSVDTIFQGMWFLSWFPWQRIATNKNGNGIRSLRNRKTWLTITEYLCHKSPRIYIYIYIQFVVITTRAFPHSWRITGFVTRVTRRVSFLQQELPTFHSRFLVGFVLLDLCFSVLFLVDHYFIFLFCP